TATAARERRHPPQPAPPPPPQVDHRRVQEVEPRRNQRRRAVPADVGERDLGVGEQVGQERGGERAVDTVGDRRDAEHPRGRAFHWCYPLTRREWATIEKVSRAASCSRSGASRWKS